MKRKSKTRKLRPLKAQLSVEYSVLTLSVLAGGWWIFSSEFFSDFIDTVTDQLFTTLIIINLPF